MPSLKRPKRPKKTNYNQPAEFTETVGGTLPLLPAVPSVPLPAVRPALHTSAIWPAMRQILRRRSVQRAGLVALWVSAAVTAGIGLGIVMSSLEPSADSGWPVSGSRLSVVRLRPASTSGVTLGPITTVSLASYQSAQGANLLQPGYQPVGNIQGTVGTKPVQ